MALSRLAQQFADEIRQHDWSDSPYRADRAGHSREYDRKTPHTLTPDQTDIVRMNLMWVVAQVLGYNDPGNFDEFEFAEACGVNTRTSSGRPRSGGIPAGLRMRNNGGVREYQRPGTHMYDE